MVKVVSKLRDIQAPLTLSNSQHKKVKVVSKIEIYRRTHSRSHI